MKAAKTLAILFAFVLAVFCLNAPMVWGGDEHPWDEEGGDQDNTGDLIPGGGGNTQTSTVTIPGGSSGIDIPVSVQVALWYYDKIGVYGMTIFIADDGKQTETSQTCKK